MNIQQAPVTKLLIVATELRPGGAEKCLTRLAQGLDRSRFLVQVVSIRSRPPESEGRLLRELEASGVPVHFLDCNSRISIFKASKKIQRIVVDQQIGIVQSFLYHANVVCGLAVGKLNRKGHPVDLFTGIRVSDPSRLRHRVERWATSNARKFICVSSAVRRFAVETMKLPSDRAISIPNGVDLESDSLDGSTLGQPLNHGPGNKPLALFVGRLHQQKGLTEFLEGLIQFLDGNSQAPEFDIAFVGDGPLRKNLEKLTGRLNDRQITFTGRLNSPGEWMERCSMMFLPSKWEGMPNVLLEAMAHGKPFVAFDIDGVADIVKTPNLQLIPAFDYPSFFQRMVELLNSPELAKKLGLENRELVQKRFTFKKMIADYEHAYLDSLSPPL